MLRGLFDGSNSSHTKHRLRLDMTAPVPGTGKRLLDFYDNNYARLLDQQARKVAADVGCVSVGIGGRAGIQSIHAMLKEQGSAEAGTNVTEGELLRFEQAVAELYGEPFGNVRCRGSSSGRRSPAAATWPSCRAWMKVRRCGLW